ncbi:hypothetical protein YOLOSWAG_264 [Erwinia phage vB_EamM_Yoloswag]|uniref:Uncharacterized protein n=1 Tax=Erwinia phage vB_EamM_Yoloswag TaxID=1958956 RepID=A0A1S6L3I4_9CAUD|nr:hypothetical protein HOR66_gp264 [Erwinia phage vB_EamM_Yoloswag]AQT28737.1 hypothetical protein YOLOSWAG_264 [Erwinia phage vB_EamM_Yoloswag]
MIKALRRMLGLWPTVEQALDQPESCVQVGENSYVVKNHAGQAAAVVRETRRLMQTETPVSYQAATTNMLRNINADTTGFPQTIFFGQAGVVTIMKVEYNICITDLYDC